MPFTTDQADELIGIIRSVPSKEAEAARNLSRSLTAALKEVNTLNEAIPPQLDLESQAAMERVGDYLRERVEKGEITLPAETQALIDLLFDIHGADDVSTDIDDKGNTLLQRALAMRSVDALQLLKEPYAVKVNEKDDLGDTLLQRMLEARDYTAVRLLVEVSGAAVDIRGHNNSAPLQIAIEQGNIEMAELFISRHCNVNVYYQDLIRRPLEIAIENEDLEMIEFLLKHKANVEVAVDGGSSLDNALRYAVEAGKLKVVKFLKEQGANIHQTLDGESLLGLATRCGHWEVFEYLIDYLDWQKEDFNKPLNSENPNVINIIKFLLKKNVQLKVDLQEALFNAFGAGDMAAVDFWLAHGAKISNETQSGERFWLESGAYGKLGDDSEGTMLHHAAISGKVEAVKRCLEAGLDLTANTANRNALHYAVKSGSLELVKYMVAEAKRRGVDINVPDEGDCYTPLAYAAEAGDIDQEMIEYLVSITPKASAEVKPNFSHYKSIAMWGDEFELMGYFLDRETNPDALKRAKQIALKTTVVYHHLGMARLLLKRGAQVDSEVTVWASETPAIAKLVKDYSVDPEAAKRIWQVVSNLIPLPEFVRRSYEGGPPITIRLAKVALRAIAENIDNRTIAGTRKKRLKHLEAKRKAVIANIEESGSVAECNRYWKQLKRVFKSTTSKKSFQAADLATQQKLLNKAFDAIPAPDTYTPRASLVLKSVDGQLPEAKSERKESKSEAQLPASLPLGLFTPATQTRSAAPFSGSFFFAEKPDVEMESIEDIKDSAPRSRIPKDESELPSVTSPPGSNHRSKRKFDKTEPGSPSKQEGPEEEGTHKKPKAETGTAEAEADKQAGHGKR